MQEIRNIVLSLKNSSAGFDQISAKVIKHILPSIVAPIYHLNNRSFQLGVFPQRLKFARVIALFKGGDREDPGNYRPISLLSVFSKIFERAMLKRLVRFLEAHFFGSAQRILQNMLVIGFFSLYDDLKILILFLQPFFLM